MTSPLLLVVEAGYTQAREEKTENRINDINGATYVQGRMRADLIRF